MCVFEVGTPYKFNFFKVGILFEFSFREDSIPFEFSIFEIGISTDKFSIREESIPVIEFGGLEIACSFEFCLTEINTLIE